MKYLLELVEETKRKSLKHCKQQKYKSIFQAECYFRKLY